jgi:oxaloacetate decarboxylase (Na+ extruding) subunit alpha
VSHIEFVDQTLRDGQQSLWGLRMRAFEAAPALPYLDKTGFRVIDLTGAGMFTVLLRQFKDDPWESTDYLVRALSNNVVRAGMRTMTIMGFGFTPDCIIDLWVQTLIKHGVGTFWLYDCLYDMPIMHRTAKMIAESGGTPVPAVMYGLTDVHTDEYFATRAAEMATWEGVETIYVEDTSGVMTPERASTLLPALQQATGKTKLELHIHNNTGMAPLVYVEGLEAGIEILHTASRPMANGPSLPSTEAILEILRVLGHTHSLDEDMLQPVAEHFHRAAIAGGHELGVPNEFSLLPYRYQLPGGMTGTLKSQLGQHGMADRLAEVLEEMILVREELGQPIMATPFSQFVGIQAVLNIVTGERYKLVPDEVIQYALGHYGPLTMPIEPGVLDRILTHPRAADFHKWERAQPTLAEVRSKAGRSMSDEELLLRVSFADDEVDAMFAAGPIRTDPRTSASTIVESIADLVHEGKGLKSFSVSQPGFSISLRRA